MKKSEWATYKPNADLKTAARCIEMLRDGGIDAVADPAFNWRIDTFPMLTRMFPHGCPPVTVISQNEFFEPHFHVEVGRLLRPLREQGYLFIGSGGGVHNLYRVHWKYNWRYRDTFAQEVPPESGNLEFRQALEDALCKNGGGPDFKRAAVRLMKHPNYRDAHGTDDHYMPTCFVAGLVGEEEDRGQAVVLGAEVWELVCMTLPAFASRSATILSGFRYWCTIELISSSFLQVNQCETQFSIGEWPANELPKNSSSG